MKLIVKVNFIQQKPLSQLKYLNQPNLHFYINPHFYVTKRK
jgi:hypothetical protein